MPMSSNEALNRPTLTISVPPDQRVAFYEALAALKEAEDRPFMSLSALVVRTILHAAAQLPSKNQTEPHA